MFKQIDRLKGHGLQVLQAILDQSQDCIKLVSNEGLLEYMNGNGRRALGIADFSMVSGQSWSALWPDESRELVDTAIARARGGEKSRFEAFCPTMLGEARWWDVSVSPIYNHDAQIEHILVTSRDITVSRAEQIGERELRLAAEQRADLRDTVSREMRHRVKNILAVVGSVARVTARQVPETIDFLPLFESRLLGLSRAQSLLAEHDDQQAQLPALVEGLLGDEGRDPRIDLRTMPAVSVDDRRAQTLALVLSELMTNAIKYGALSCDGGRIVLSATSDDRDVFFEWGEYCDFEIDPPRSEGSGSVLMRRITAGETIPIRLNWGRRGLSVRFSVRRLPTLAD